MKGADMETQTIQIKGEIISECKNKLMLMREDILNRIRSAKFDFSAQEKMSGDEIDQTVAQINENNFLLAQSRLRQQFVEIEFALARIQNGTYGICEETQEIIETERLLALPFTRLSLEGAELRESFQKKLAP
jgi:DnaK suppressor protein